MEFNKELKEDIIKELNERIQKLNKNFSCPVCKNKEFNVIDGFTKRSVDQDFSKIILGGPTLPSISVICSNCGNILDFALGSLGFLNQSKKEEEKKDEKSKN